MKHLFVLLCFLLHLPALWALRPVPGERPDTLVVPDTAEVEILEPEPEDARPLRERLASLLDDPIFERTQVGLYVYDLTADTLVFAHNARQCMRPASNEKLVTSIAALSSLGTDYRFRTRLYAEGCLGEDSVWNGRIFVRGGYDPLLDASDLRAMAADLRALGVKGIAGSIVLDRSIKDKKQWGWGWCWDDDEVPLDPLLLDNKAQFATGLRRALREAGIAWDGSTTEGTTPAGAKLVSERTHTLDAVLLPMMKRSDNSMAEAVFYQIAARSGQPYAGRKLAVAEINRLIRSLGLDPSHYQIADGSGLSLYNYLTPQLLGYLLRYAYREQKLYQHLLPTLPIAGEDGTLRKRMRGTPAEGNVQAKTGTVEGVSTLSGYCTAASGNRLCFSIMNQGIRHSSTGRHFQDRVCSTLCR